MSDLISRQAAIDAICGECQGTCIPCEHYPCGEIKALEQLPSAQPEQKVGKWIRHKDEDGEPYGHNCSICGEWYVMPYGKTKFCPNCGAKMEEKDD